jgi:hypothetical protein
MSERRLERGTSNGRATDSPRQPGTKPSRTFWNFKIHNQSQSKFRFRFASFSFRVATPTKIGIGTSSAVLKRRILRRRTLERFLPTRPWRSRNEQRATVPSCVSSTAETEAKRASLPNGPAASTYRVLSTKAKDLWCFANFVDR